MALNEEDYWPESLAVELKSLVRKEKFDFNAVSEKLIAFAREGDSLENIEITPKTCREAFARDYSKAPYAVDSKKKAMKPVKTANPAPSEAAEEVKSTRVAISVTEEDEEEAGAFDLDFDDKQDAAPEPKKKDDYVPLPPTDGPDLSYEEVLENIERIEEANFKRKEAVFTKVAKLLMLDGYTDGDEENADNQDKDKDASEAIIDRSKRSTNPMDAEVLRAFQEGRKKRAEEKLKRATAVAEAEEWRKIQSDRERLRRRFDKDSEDAAGDSYEGLGDKLTPDGITTTTGGSSIMLSKQEEAEKEQYEHFVRTMLGGGPSGASHAAVQAATGGWNQAVQPLLFPH